ncbi:ferredoxin [Nocardioides aquiterrae]|uniref:Ferredoxin n=1 Tax=Nocardioides aquiterrae TaxID=203799 RepID=A0ABP4EQJ9_9ACTN
MRIEVDRDVCEGVGMCQSMAHEFFELDDDDVLEVLDPTPPEARRGEVAAAVASCPVQALRLEG